MSTMSAVRAKLARRRPAGLDARLAGLEQAVLAAQGRLDGELTDEVSRVVERARTRLRLSADHTVVAIAGATGSGKSSLFNRLCGLELAEVGARRPTTAETLACVWGGGADDLLDWLGVPPRRRVERLSALDAGQQRTDLHGLVLLDLPDHDSTEVAHHLEVQRLAGLVDSLIWVLDPQKYADAAVHERFLQPMAAYDDIITVVFNHVDELAPDTVDAAVADVRRLLVGDGLPDVPLIVTSAVRGDGIPGLHADVVRRVADKETARGRLSADLVTAAQSLSAVTGSAHPESVAAEARGTLVEACADAAGAPVVVEAVRVTTELAGRRATGWPPTRWISRLRPDPLRRLHLGADVISSLDGPAPRTSLPPATPEQRARVATAVRSAAASVSDGLPPAWQSAIRRASQSELERLPDALDTALARTSVEPRTSAWWWPVAGIVQWVCLGVAALGAVWLIAIVALAALTLGAPDTPRWVSIPVPTWLLAGGLAAGLLLSALGRWRVRRFAVRLSRRVQASLDEAVGEVVDVLVVRPVAVEVDAYRACRDGIAVAAGNAD